MELGLGGKVAIVTGGSEGIGRATAILLAAEGASVVIGARRQGPLDEAADAIKANGGECLAMSTDVTSDDDCERLVAAAIERFGGVDILINNAGQSSSGLIESHDIETWAVDLDLKLYGAIRASRLAVPIMREQGGGRIINVTNLGAKAPGAASVPTSVSRAAGVALTKAMSKEFAADNILVTTVCIGLIKSGQHETRFRSMQESQPDLTLDQFYAGMGDRVPIGRVGEAEEAGDVIAFLASARASYLTGIAINIDGGTSPVL